MLLSMCASSTDAAQAQQVFGKIQAFGDSYVDTGNALAIARANNPALYAGLAALYPTGRFSGGTNYVDTISSLLGIPQANYAIGGAKADNTNTIPGLPGFRQEWQGFLASGMTIAPSDLVVLNIGGNDARTYYQSGGSLAGAPAAAAQSAGQTIAGVNALVAAGARTLVYTVGDVSALPEAAAFPNAATGSAFSQAYNYDTQAALGRIAASGVRVEYVDIGLIGKEILANPAAYGITYTGACPLTCVGNPALQNQYLYYVDGLHLTSHGFAILGEYILNRLEAPATLPPQANVGSATALAFAQTLFSRMDLFGGSEGDAVTYQRELADLPAHPAPIAVRSDPWSVYMLSDGGVGDGARTSAGAGYTFTSLGGTVGAEYRGFANTLIGASFNYENPELKLDGNRGTTRADSYQFGLYGTYAVPSFFVQGLVLGGGQTYRNLRPGVVDVITSGTDGSTFVAGGKVGKLYDTRLARVGPIAGLLYGRAGLGGYGETGDPALVLTVHNQVQQTLLASGGVQLRFPLGALGALEPYVNLTVESNVVGDGRLIQYGATSAPLIVNTLAVPGADSRRPYGRVAGGVTAPLAGAWAFTAFATTTIDRPGGNDFSGSGGLRYAF